MISLAPPHCEDLDDSQNMSYDESFNKFMDDYGNKDVNVNTGDMIDDHLQVTNPKLGNIFFLLK